MKWAGIGVSGIGAIATFGSIMPGTEETAVADTNPAANPHPVNANDAWKRLLEGNQRFVAQKPKQCLLPFSQVRSTGYPEGTIEKPLRKR